MTTLLLETTRGALVEERQLGDVAVADAAGQLIAAAGDPFGTVAFWRSSAKPFQTAALVRSGAADAFELSGEDLALVSASHNAEPEHVARVASLLERIGCGAGDLRCGSHPPLDAATADQQKRRGEAPTALHSNCSGKHAGMLAFARHLGAPLGTYRDPDHPVQREILATVARFTGADADAIARAPDGCGVPTFALSVHRMAVAFARLMSPEEMGEDREAAVRVRDAMIAHPYLVAGRARFDTDIMRRVSPRLVAKGGASGVQCVGVAGGFGVAVKLAGSRIPGQAGGAALEALRQMGWVDSGEVSDLIQWWRPENATIAGERVGETRPAFRLERVPVA